VQQHLDAERLEALDVLGGEAAKLIDVDCGLRVGVGLRSERDRVRRRGRDLRRGLLDVGQRVAEQVARDGLRCGA
jgi:hypothetical protein